MENKGEKQPSDEEVTKAQLLDLLNDGKTTEVLQLCRPMGLMYELLQEQLNNLDKDFEKGLVGYLDMELIRNRIKFAARNSIERLPEGPIDFQYWQQQADNADFGQVNEGPARKPPFWERLKKQLFR